jgi:dihydroorotate dehydrogenase (NAD+) catalytic subunit
MRDIVIVNMSQGLFYDPSKTFEENSTKGPFNLDQKDYRHNYSPRHTFLGFKIQTPFGIAAGPLPTSGHTNAAFRLGYDVVCYKTQRTVKFKPNQFPHILSLDIDGDLTPEKAAQGVVGKTEIPRDTSNLTITNSFGNPSSGPDFWVDDLKEALKGVGPGQLLIMSVVGTIQDGFTREDYYEDFAKAARLAKKAGAKAIEINLSCPNVANEGILCYSEDAVLDICKRVKKTIGDTPLVAKLGYFSDAQQQTLENIVLKTHSYVAAYSSINTIPGNIVDENGNQALPGKNRLQSGCCGAGIRWAGLDMVSRLNQIRKLHNLNYEIIGVGGVMNAKDYQALIDKGANCVQSVTGAMWNQHLAQEIKQTIN